MVNTTMRAVIIRVTTLNSYAGAANRRLRASPPRMTKRQWYKRSCKGGPVAVAGGFVCANGERGVIEAGCLRDTTVSRNRGCAYETSVGGPRQLISNYRDPDTFGDVECPTKTKIQDACLQISCNSSVRRR